MGEGASAPSPKDIIRLCEKHRDMAFHAFTNGTLIDEEFCREMLRVGNFFVSISVEGFEEANDGRRGQGHFQKAMDAMDLMHSHRIAFGVSICYTSRNYKVVTSDDFLGLLISKGCVFAWYFHYMPVGLNADTSLLLTPKQRAYMKDRVREIRGITGGKELYCIDFQNDGEFAGGWWPKAAPTPQIWRCRNPLSTCAKSARPTPNAGSPRQKSSGRRSTPDNAIHHSYPFPKETRPPIRFGWEGGSLCNRPMRQALQGFGGRAHKPRLRRPGPDIGHGRIRFKPRPRKEDRLRQQRLNVCLALLHAAAAGGAEHRHLSPREIVALGKGADDPGSVAAPDGIADNDGVILVPVFHPVLDSRAAVRVGLLPGYPGIGPVAQVVLGVSLLRDNAEDISPQHRGSRFRHGFCIACGGEIRHQNVPVSGIGISPDAAGRQGHRRYHRRSQHRDQYFSLHVFSSIHAFVP